MYYIYMIRCIDNSIYTGITTDLERRFKEHCEKNQKCAKYTLNHTAVRIECAWTTENKSLASKLEFHLKRLTKKEKEDIIINNDLEKFLSDRIDISKYKRIEREKL